MQSAVAALQNAQKSLNVTVTAQGAVLAAVIATNSSGAGGAASAVSPLLDARLTALESMLPDSSPLVSTVASLNATLTAALSLLGDSLLVSSVSDALAMGDSPLVAVVNAMQSQTGTSTLVSNLNALNSAVNSALAGIGSSTLCKTSTRCRRR